MLPEHLVPSRFHLSTSPTNTDTVENSENLTQGKTTLSEFEADILISATATGQTRNMLFEECDRHLKERLFRAAKIESFIRLLNSLQAEGDINAQELSKILAKNTALINEQGNKIWLNLLTRETSDPIFILWKRNKMKDAEDNNVYLALDNYKSDEFVLKQNLDILIANKNATLESVAQEMVSIPAAPYA